MFPVEGKKVASELLSYSDNCGEVQSESCNSADCSRQSWDSTSSAFTSAESLQESNRLSPSPQTTSAPLLRQWSIVSQGELDDRWTVLREVVTREDLQLTPVTHRLRETHPGCSTIKYNRKKPSLNDLKKRIHTCSFPGYYYSNTNVL